MARRLTTGRPDTGQDACYFYNRVEGAEVRWVSYHFHADPELNGADAAEEEPG